MSKTDKIKQLKESIRKLQVQIDELVPVAMYDEDGDTDPDAYQENLEMSWERSELKAAMARFKMEIIRLEKVW